jgi:hypothetical protein
MSEAAATANLPRKATSEAVASISAMKECWTGIDKKKLPAKDPKERFTNSAGRTDQNQEFDRSALWVAQIACPFRVKMRKAQYEQMFSALPLTTDVPRRALGSAEVHAKFPLQIQR